MSTQYAKTEANARHLLDGFIALKERYAFVHHMIFDQGLVAARGGGQRGRGFETLRRSLLLTCIQDIAKFTLDRDRRAPSLANIALSLADEVFRDELRERYSVLGSIRPDDDEFDDPAALKALNEIEARETQTRRLAFDDAYRQFTEQWAALKDSPTLLSASKVRDKVTAHTEIRFENEQYVPFDISTLGIKYGDIRIMIDQVQDLVRLVGLIVRSAGFDWEGLDEQLSNAVHQFWAP